MKLGFGAILCALSLVSCGYIGPPLAPTLDLPQRVTNLQAIEYGNQIIAEFDLSLLTTEGLPLKTVESLEMRIGVAPSPWNDNAWAASAKRYDLPKGLGHVSFRVPAGEWIGKEVAVRVRATGPKGKTSDWSNIATLPVQPPLPAPTDLQVENTRAGLYATWKFAGKPGTKFRVFFKTEDEEPKFRGTTNDPNWNEPTIEFGTHYQLFVQAVEGELQQSDTVASKVIVPTDDFTPGVPAGLTATQGAASIELSWERNTDARFQGYNVFRSVDGGPAEKVASLIIAPAYSDSKIETGKKYRYTVSAVGTNGLESAQSAAYEIAAQ